MQPRETDGVQLWNEMGIPICNTSSICVSVQTSHRYYFVHTMMLRVIKVLYAKAIDLVG